MQVGFDLRAINVTEGVRAALACAAVIIANEWIDWPPLLYMALAANLACFCDVGGPIRPRVVALLAFTALGAVTWDLFGLLRPAGLPIVVPLACAAILCNSFARVWGLSAQAVGNLLSVTLVFALDEPLKLPEAGVIGAMFIAGGGWATLLTMVVWRQHPYRPARLAVGEAWRLLAELSADLRDLARRKHVDAADWEAHARAHRRAVRDAIENARTIVMDLVRMRGAASLRGSQALLWLETGDQLFGSLIALSDLLEDADPPARAAGAQMLRLLRPLLLVFSRSMQADTAIPPPRLERTVAAILSDAAIDPALQRIAEAMADRLRIAVKLATPGNYLPGDTIAGEPTQPWRERLLGPIRANLTWDSAILRHALRAAVVAAPALAVTLRWEGVFSHWLTITVVLTMQPFFAATWQRALERIGGTVLGGLIGAVLAYFAHSPLVLAAMMFPLCVIGFGARQVSYGAYIACLTPQLVVLVELIHPGHSSWEIAEMRALFTVIGGIIAVAGCRLLWPSWEPGRLRRELRTALAAHSRYAEAVLSEIAGEAGEAATEQARRSAGVATNNLEASLSRALQEPKRMQREQLEAAAVIDATARRFAGRLSALRHDPASRSALDADSWRRWRAWLTAALAAVAAGSALPPRPETAQVETLSRIARQIDLLEGAIRRFGSLTA